MNTARDLAIVALDSAPERPLEQGDLSLALAGAELLDLADAGALSLDGDHIVPGTASDTGDRLLDGAAALLVRERPYESVEDWLWRRGRELAAAYTADLEKDGLAARPRGRRIPLRASRAELVDSPERGRARERLTAGDPVLTALASAAGVGGDGGDTGGGATGADLSEDEGKATDETRTDDSLTTEPLADEPFADESLTAVLAAVGGAVMELEAVRQRRAIENAAFDNVWRGW
ncbi:GPP34 family phosphoprotein [Streptomyces sp. NPDC056716]|uniref:GOLPH3/VPS74 family protein n=1 Tax=unclassified Streptomyces TaxID=2593676 RepID=UPI00368373FB